MKDNHQRSSNKTWISSPLGGKYNSYDVTKSDYTLTDLCSSVAHINRFNGSAGHMPNVAAHLITCYEVTSILYDDPKYAVFAAIHDLHEAFIGDIATPIQRAIEYFVKDHCNVICPPEFIKILKSMKKRIDKNIIETLFSNAIKWEQYFDFIHSKEFVAIDEAVMCWEADLYLKNSEWTKDFFPNAMNVGGFATVKMFQGKTKNNHTYAELCAHKLFTILNKWENVQ